MQGKKDYQEKLFIRFQLSDYVPADNFYRRLRSILDLSFLYDSTAKYYGNEGQKSIDPVVFFKLMLVGYLENMNSDRRIIITSRMRMDILYFIGYDLDEELPWHSTLSRTRQLYGEETFTAIFKTVLKQCIDNGLVAGRRQAVDSVLVKANAALSSVVERQILDDAAGYGKELDAHTEKLSSDNIIHLPDHLSASQASAKQKPKPVNQARVSPSDTDARISYKPGKVLALNYLSQVSVDTSNHVITHIQAFHADKGDGQCLPEILTQTVNTLKENGLTVHEVLADSGYSSEPGLLALIEHQIEGYIPNRSGYKDDREGFTYDKEHDRYLFTGKIPYLPTFQSQRQWPA
ncbi:transposase [Mucilaginibacter sabulilitoris]|uniref:Transposase n=1 Tax=Mucilaginibacter sabulilitoris TaxID=1173583 RepID=A0ABZ0TFY6_9SPHI|nr:transposase [Mucilaginibacter sabulilitoris]WPU92087.1 transposase [Mucilaginibacter sabulilitoris]